MIKQTTSKTTLEIPNNVKVHVNDKQLFVKGPLGEIKRDFSHTDSSIIIILENRRIIIEAFWPNKKTAATIGTINSHIKNMITGVLKGFTVKLTIVFSHFPISVNVQDDRVIIENFHGERLPRKASIFGRANVKIDGDNIIIQGIDLEHVTQTAANIQQATQIKKKDPRVFLDGIYVFEKSEGM